MPDELTPTALAKIPSWALVQEPSQDNRDAIHTLLVLMFSIDKRSFLVEIEEIEGIEGIEDPSKIQRDATA